MKAVWNGEVVAESDDTVVVEGNHYFPRESIANEFFEPSSRTSVCPWKGLAHCYSLNVGGKRNDDAAWFYDDPSVAAQNIKGRVAFWKGVEVHK